jgi:hypothetical protein
MLTKRQLEIFWIIFKNQPLGIGNILPLIETKISIPTLNRELATLKEEALIQSVGIGPSTKYNILPKGLIITELPVDEYYNIDSDNRVIYEKFNYAVFKELSEIDIFSKDETEQLDTLTAKYKRNIKEISAIGFKKEFERLTGNLHK